VLLLYRLWRVDRSLPGIVPFPLEQETPVQRIMRSIAESGMLYTVAAFIVLICEVTQSAHVLRVATAVVRKPVAIDLRSSADMNLFQGIDYGRTRLQSHSSPSQAMGG